mmetsp:Transcript_123012/g.359047  ORF Transcript_123012/g.359047 Transcript_123012/m.359047 type:complete len:412 (+) Transcript_123012:388-1623(+)
MHDRRRLRRALGHGEERHAGACRDAGLHDHYAPLQLRRQQGRQDQVHAEVRDCDPHDGGHLPDQPLRADLIHDREHDLGEEAHVAGVPCPAGLSEGPSVHVRRLQRNVRAQVSEHHVEQPHQRDVPSGHLREGIIAHCLRGAVRGEGRVGAQLRLDQAAQVEVHSLEQQAAGQVEAPHDQAGHRHGQVQAGEADGLRIRGHAGHTVGVQRAVEQHSKLPKSRYHQEAKEDKGKEVTPQLSPPLLVPVGVVIRVYLVPDLCIVIDPEHAGAEDDHQGNPQGDAGPPEGPHRRQEGPALEDGHGRELGKGPHRGPGGGVQLEGASVAGEVEQLQREDKEVHKVEHDLDVEGLSDEELWLQHPVAPVALGQGVPLGKSPARGVEAPGGVHASSPHRGLVEDDVHGVGHGLPALV